MTYVANRRRWVRPALISSGVAIVALLAIAASVIALISAGRAPHAIISALSHSDTPQPSDLLLILGGDYQTRIPAAARLFHEGYAPKILLLREPIARHPMREHRANFTEISLQMLKQAGVPDDRVIYFAPGEGVRSTADEARACKLYVSLYPAHRILIVTSMFHCMRARMVFRRALPDADIRVIGVESLGVTTVAWDQTKFGRDFVRLEFIKLLYYFCVFHG